MSHAHRDEHALAGPAIEEPAPVTVTPPAPVVTNSEAERRAIERRAAEGAPEQVTQHAFTGDLPEPDRGGSDTETRLVFGAADTGDDVRPGTATAMSRRGPPPPRARQLDHDASWAAPPTLDGAGWSGAITRAWIRRPRGG